VFFCFSVLVAQNQNRKLKNPKRKTSEPTRVTAIMKHAYLDSGERSARLHHRHCRWMFLREAIAREHFSTFAAAHPCAAGRRGAAG
jgi:hypothetical protein